MNIKLTKQIFATALSILTLIELYQNHKKSKKWKTKRT